MVLEALEQAAVVAARLHHEVSRTELQQAGDRLGIVYVMSRHRIGRACHVHIIVKQDLRMDDIQQLDQRAIVAVVDIQRVTFFSCELGRIMQECVRQRHRAEREE